jgi:hypothetical protein
MGDEKWYSTKGSILFQDMLDCLDELGLLIMEDVARRETLIKEDLERIVESNIIRCKDRLIRTYEAERR